MESSLRKALLERRVIIIDKKSMVSNNLLYVHLRLKERFGTVRNQPLVGLTIITVGDFLKLLPVGGKPVYATYKIN